MEMDYPLRSSAVTSSADAELVFVAELDTEGTIIEANESLCQLLRSPKEKLVGRRFWDVMPRPLVATAQDLFLTAVSDSSLPSEVETPLVDSEGMTHVILWRPVWRDPDRGDRRRIIAVGLDITELRRAQRRVTRVSDLLARVNHPLVPQALNDPSRFMTHACERCMETPGYGFAWAVLFDDSGRVADVAGCRDDPRFRAIRTALASREPTCATESVARVEADPVLVWEPDTFPFEGCDHCPVRTIVTRGSSPPATFAVRLSDGDVLVGLLLVYTEQPLSPVERAEEIESLGILGESIGARLGQVRTLSQVSQVRDELALSESMFHALFADTGVAAALLDDRLRFIRVSPAFEIDLNISANEIIWRDIFEVFPQGTARPYFEHALESGEIVRLTARPLQLEGEADVRYYDLTIAPVSRGGGQVEMLCLGVHDVTDLVRARETVEEALGLLEGFFEHLVTPVALLDADFRFLRVNRAYAASVEHTAEDLIGQNHFELYPSAEAEAIFSRVLETGEPYRVEARPFVNPEFPQMGVTYWDWTLARVGEEGHAFTLILSLRDVTERTLAEKKVAEYQRNLQEFAQRQSSILRHERRRVARAIHDNLGQLLDLAKIRAEQAAAASSPDRRTELIGQISDMLDECSEFADALTFELSPPILREVGLVAAIHWLADQLQAKHGLRVEVAGDVDQHPMSEETKDILFGAVRELLINVVKHAGTPRVVVNFSIAQDTFTVTVQDDGGGFDPSEVARSRTESRSFGLFAVEESLSHIGGTVDAHSEPGRGTCVTLSAPLFGQSNETGELT